VFFFTSKYGKCTIKVLKSALIDFYSDKDITAAKTRLLPVCDLRSMDLAEKVPHHQRDETVIVDSRVR